VEGRRLGEEKDAPLLLCPLPQFLGACNSIFRPYLCIFRARGHMTCPKRSRTRWRTDIALIFKLVYKMAKSGSYLRYVCPSVHSLLCQSARDSSAPTGFIF